MTTNNFFTRINSIIGYSAGDGNGSGDVSYSQEFSLEYDASTGILNIVGTSKAEGHTYFDNGTGTARGSAQVLYSLWCVY